MSHLLAPPCGSSRSALEKKWNVRSKPRRDVLNLVFRKIEPQQLIGAEKKSRGVAASAPETGSDRDSLGEPYAHSAHWCPALGEEGPGPLDNVGTVAWNRHAARIERNPLAGFLEKKLILQRDRLHDGVDLVIPIRAAPQDPQTEVDLRGTADPERA